MAAPRPLSDATDASYSTPLHTPLHLDSPPLDPPSAPYFANFGALNLGPSLSPTPRGSYYTNTADADEPRAGASPSNSTPFLAASPGAAAAAATADTNPGSSRAFLDAAEDAPGAALTEKGANARASRTPLYKRPLFWLFGAAALVAVVLAVVLPVYFVVVKPRNDANRAASGSSSDPPAAGGSGSSGTVGGGSGNPASPSGATSGGNGSQVTTDSGETFTYLNQFGGYCECSIFWSALRRFFLPSSLIALRGFDHFRFFCGVSVSSFGFCLCGDRTNGGVGYYPI